MGRAARPGGNHTVTGITAPRRNRSIRIPRLIGMTMNTSSTQLAAKSKMAAIGIAMAAARSHGDEELVGRLGSLYYKVAQGAVSDPDGMVVA